LSNFLARATVIGLSIGLAAGAVLYSFSGRDVAAEPPRPNPMWHPAAASAEDGLGALHYVATPAAAVDGIDVPSRPATVSHSLRVGRGDTLMDILVDAGVVRREAHEAIVALREFYDPRKLMPGQEIRVILSGRAEGGRADGGRADGGSTNGGRLLGLGLRPNVEQELRVTRDGDDGFIAEKVARQLLRVAINAEGRIDNNLSAAAQDAGLPMPVLVEMIRIFSFDVDFQRELQPGDSFEVLYEALFEDDGSLAKTDGVLYASLTLSGQRLDMYNFTPHSGHTDFFDGKGQSVRKTLMRTPIDGARLSSRFGMRKHPVLGYSRLHKGTDFAAPRGTPIYAAGDGVVESAGRNGAYGKYVRIRHNSTYKTAYAHMKRIAKGMRRGKRVRQGQVIGYVGSTGRSTGPHLHYEVLRGGRQVNPLKIKLPSGEKLKAAEMESFERRRARIDALRQQVRDGDAVIAQAGCQNPTGDAAPSEAGAC
jgi:murein DD-endopeptidase MepM/ murein hydrolase activator NlpD